MKLFLNKYLPSKFNNLVFLISIYSFFLGYTYSEYQQDYHHGSYILSSFLDYKNNFKLFEEIYLQYGPGQIFFLSLVSNFVNINFFSISIITSFVFSLNLILLFRVFCILLSKNLSLIFVFIIFLIHPFPIYPWPDYLSGLSLTIFFYFFLKKNSSSILFTLISSFFLFLSVFFRGSYLINIFLSILIFFTLGFFFKKKVLIKNFLFFFIFILLYFVILYLNNNLVLWFSQNFYSVRDYNIPEYVHNFFFIAYLNENIVKAIHLALSFLSSLFNFRKLGNLFFLICIISSLSYIFLIIKKKISNSLLNTKLLYICLLGLFGFIQSFSNYAIFRNVNSSIGVFIGLAFFYEKYNFFIRKLFVINILKFILIIYIFFLILKFPNNSTIFDLEKKYNKIYYTELNINFFSKNKKIINRSADYYNDLSIFLCKDNFKILNFSGDFALSYLCNSRNVKSISTMQIFILKRYKYSEYERIFLKNDLYNDELLIVSEEIFNSKIQLVYSIKSPHVPKFWYGDIFVYKLKN